MKLAALVVALALLAGCASIREKRYALTPEANTCQANEVRASWLSTIASLICWDKEGRPMGMVGATGMPAAAVPLEILGAAAAVVGPLGGAAILGGKLVEAAKAAQNIDIDVEGRGRVDIEGRGRLDVNTKSEVKIDADVSTSRVKVPK